MTVPACPTHGTPLVMFCPACRGKSGGKVSTEAKAEAARANGAKGGRPKKKRRATPKAP